MHFGSGRRVYVQEVRFRAEGISSNPGFFPEIYQKYISELRKIHSLAFTLGNIKRNLYLTAIDSELTKKKDWIFEAGKVLKQQKFCTFGQKTCISALGLFSPQLHNL